MLVAFPNTLEEAVWKDTSFVALIWPWRLASADANRREIYGVVRPLELLKIAGKNAQDVYTSRFQHSSGD